MSTIIELADAVAHEINSAPEGWFGAPLAAARQVLPAHRLEDLADLRVTVVPKSVESSGSSRALTRLDWRIDVGVQKKLGRDIESEVDGLCALVERLGSFLRRRPLERMPLAAWTDLQNDPVYAPEHLAEHRVFTSVVTLTYRALL